MELINKPIEMIAVFNKEGNIKPIRFRLMNEDAQYNVVKIEHVNVINKEKYQGIWHYIFVCVITLNNRQRLCEITYNTQTLEWKLRKI